MSNAWGILGNPSAKQIETWKNLPYGKFKEMVSDLKKKSKNKSLRKHVVEVKKVSSESTSTYIEVEAFDSDHAVNLAKDEFRKDEPRHWTTSCKESDKYFYRVSNIW